MKLAIASNFMYSHVGGSEIVLQAISERLTQSYDYDVTCFGKNVRKKNVHNNVKYEGIPTRYEDFVSGINKGGFDHLFVYSDYFIFWSKMVVQPDAIKCSKSIALVGMNQMIGNPNLSKFFRRTHDGFTVITHSNNYLDHKECTRLKIPVKVIPNGVDLKEFDDCEIDFRKRFDIPDKPILLCVSNFFPGKGQDHLSNILQYVTSDFYLVLISTTVSIPMAKMLATQVRQQLAQGRIKHKFLQDIGRESTVAAFKAADIFVFPSLKEVAPLVLMESMAANTPWISMPVGNATDLAGGVVVQHPRYDVHRNIKYSDQAHKMFGDEIESLLNDRDRRMRLGSNGRVCIEENHNWYDICKQYHEIFSHGSTVS